MENLQLISHWIFFHWFFIDFPRFTKVFCAFGWNADAQLWLDRPSCSKHKNRTFKEGKKCGNTKENRISVFPRKISVSCEREKPKATFCKDKRIKISFYAKRKGKMIRTNEKKTLIFYDVIHPTPFILQTGRLIVNAWYDIVRCQRFNCFVLLLVVSLLIFYWSISADRNLTRHLKRVRRGKTLRKVVKFTRGTFAFIFGRRLQNPILLFICNHGAFYDHVGINSIIENIKASSSCDLLSLTFQIIIRWFIVQTCIILLTSFICMKWFHGRGSPKYCKSLYVFGLRV